MLGFCSFSIFEVFRDASEPELTQVIQLWDISSYFLFYFESLECVNQMNSTVLSF